MDQTGFPYDYSRVQNAFTLNGLMAAPTFKPASENHRSVHGQSAEEISTTSAPDAQKPRQRGGSDEVPICIVVEVFIFRKNL
jgi:hypothetical protein